MNALKVYQFGREVQFLPFFLPKGKAGKCRITQTVLPAGTEVTVVSLRNALFMGLRPTKCVLSCDTIEHTLQEDGTGTWMRSYPQEIEQAERQSAAFKGRVLVGGLGLGLVVSLLPKAVEDIVVVEKNPNVIKLVGQWLRFNRPCQIVRADLYQYIEQAKARGERFDYAFYDIWCPTGEMELARSVIPLRRASVGLVEQSHLECWNEDEMLGQVRMGIETQICFMGQNVEQGCSLISLSDAKFHEVAMEGRRFRQDWPFWNFVRTTKPAQKQMPKLVDEYMAGLKDPAKYESWKQWEVA